MHPAVVHFPLALVAFSVVADVTGYFAGSRSLQNAAWWTIAGATAGAALAVVAGLIDMNRENIEPAAHEYVHVHMRIGFLVLLSVAALSFWRWTIYNDATGGPGALYLTGAVLVFFLTLLQGFIGGELVYSHGVGVAPTGQGTTTARNVQDRLAWPLGARPANSSPEHKEKHEHSD